MQKLARALALLLLLLGAPGPGAAAAATPGPETAGRLFSQAGGYAVTNGDGVRFWDAFQALGGVEAVGYPVSRRFLHAGFVTQVMQKAVFQWRPDSGSVSFVNVFDDLSKAGRDDWLLSVRSTPRPLAPGWDGGADWASVVRARTALLDARPAIRRRYDATPDALQRYGLPTSQVQDMGTHFAARLQRAVIQEWKVEVPWARAGEVTVANGGDIMKEAGLIPPDALAPEGSSTDPFAGAPAPPPPPLATLQPTAVPGGLVPVSSATAPSDGLAPVAATPTPLPAGTPAAFPGALPTAAPLATPAAAPGVDARVVVDVAIVRRGPSDASSEVGRLFRNGQVEQIGEAAGGWAPVRLWNALVGWLPTTTITTEPYPERDRRPGSGYRRPIPPAPAASVALAIAAPAVTVRSTDLAAAPGGAGVGALPAGAAVRLVGYQTDPGGRTWLQLQRDDLIGWAPAAAVSVTARDPLAPTAGGRPVAAAVAGKGFWATYDLLDRASPEAIVETMRANGLTHLYLQVGRSNLGFYGGPGLDRLLPVAHAAGLAVVAWVYPFLKDTTADVNLTMQAARYVTPDGHRPDALAADVEENMGVDEVQAYGQLVRAMVGDDYPLVVATFPPEMAQGRTYPFAVVARSWNVIAPMDYYHRPGRPYPADEAFGYVARSVQLIRERVGRPVAVAPIGQAYGMLWPNEIGPTNPDGPETAAMLRAAREAGALGISFFEWSHATAPQWREIGAFRW